MFATIFDSRVSVYVREHTEAKSTTEIIARISVAVYKYVIRAGIEHFSDSDVQLIIDYGTPIGGHLIMNHLRIFQQQQQQNFR